MLRHLMLAGWHSNVTDIATFNRRQSGRPRSAAHAIHIGRARPSARGTRCSDWREQRQGPSVRALEHAATIRRDGCAPGSCSTDAAPPIQLPTESLLRDRRASDRAHTLLPAVGAGRFCPAEIGRAQRKHRLGMVANLGAFPRLLSQRPLLLQGREVRLGPVQLLAELHHPPFLRGDGPKKVVAIVVDIEGHRSSSRKRGGRAVRRLGDRGHGSRRGDFGGIRGGGWRLV